MTSIAERADSSHGDADADSDAPRQDVARDDPRAAAKLDSAALRDLLSPVRGRLRLGKALQLIASAATVVPFIGLVELGRTLLADGPLDTDRVWTIVWVVLGALGVRALLSGLALGVTHFADVELQSVLRRRIVDALSRAPLGWFTRTSSGRVRKALQNDIGDMHHLVAHADVETTAAWATTLFSLIYCFTLDWRLGILAVATLPLYVVAYAWMMRDATARMAQMNEGMAKISATIVEFVSGVAVVKTFGQAGCAHQAFLDAADDFNDGFARYVTPLLRIEALATMTLCAPLILLVNASGGYWFVREGWVTPIEVLGATLVAMVLPTTILTLTTSVHSRQEAAAAARRIIDMLALPPLPLPAQPQVPQDNSVEFDGVSFSYPGDDDHAGVLALDDVSLRVAPGSMTALVGSSGSGKSTLATLVPRFGDPQAGSVRIGGVDVRDIDPQMLYRHVGFVLQDVALLAVSLRDNIILGRPDATDEEVEQVARAAHIHDRILRLPRGYDSVIGVDAHLSGGEEQRVSIARALLADAPILVLDEATAFADPDSEAQIQSAVATLVIDRTVVVIAHRLGTITHADTIVVLDSGRVVEQGRHDELLTAGGCYAAMWETYLRGTGPSEDLIADQIEGEARR